GPSVFPVVTCDPLQWLHLHARLRGGMGGLTTLIVGFRSHTGSCFKGDSHGIGTIFGNRSRIAVVVPSAKRRLNFLLADLSHVCFSPCRVGSAPIPLRRP